MHLCLSCNQECSTSFILCDSCRRSLLESREKLMQEAQPEMAQVGNVEGEIDLMSLPRLEAVPVGPEEKVEPAVSEQTEEKHAWSFETSSLHKVELAEG